MQTILGCGCLTFFFTNDRKFIIFTASKDFENKLYSSAQKMAFSKDVRKPRLKGYVEQGPKIFL